MTYPKLCKDCKHSKPDDDSKWRLRCHNPIVNGKDPWALASASSGGGSDCVTERERMWPAKCGMRGAQWQVNGL